MILVKYSFAMNYDKDFVPLYAFNYLDRMF
jgi:hypothetical protein